MSLTLERRFHFSASGRCKEMQRGAGPEPPAIPAGRVPRVSRLMALAVRFDDLIRRGEVADYATLARLGHVTRARVTQVMNLLLLAPDIQEAVLFLPPVERGRDPIRLADLQPIALTKVWPDQRRMWRRLAARAPGG